MRELLMEKQSYKNSYRLEYNIGDVVRITPFVRAIFYLPDTSYLIIHKGNPKDEYPYAVVLHTGLTFHIKSSECFCD